MGMFTNSAQTRAITHHRQSAKSPPHLVQLRPRGIPIGLNGFATWLVAPNWLTVASPPCVGELVQTTLLINR
jgi:hypothetical protein